MKVEQLERQLEKVRKNCFPGKPMSAYRIFENKHFNQYKLKMPHLSAHEIQELIYQKWKHGLSPAE